jgi:hypothetical protein
MNFVFVKSNYGQTLLAHSHMLQLLPSIKMAIEMNVKICPRRSATQLLNLKTALWLARYAGQSSSNSSIKRRRMP